MKKGTGSKLHRIMAAPQRALCRARDLYVGSMVGLAARGSCRVAVGAYPGGAASGVPRGYCFPTPGAGGSDDDLAELVRATSQAAATSPNASAGGDDKVGCAPAGKGSAAMGRIDEDKPCELGWDAMVDPPCRRRSSCCPALKKNRVGVLP